MTPQRIFLRLEYFRRRAVINPAYHGEFWIFKMEVDRA